MFPYDSALSAAVGRRAETVAAVLDCMHTIDSLCVDGDGLKWFNWLYLQVTTAVEARIAAGEFGDREWLSTLDVQFAQIYFDALGAALSGGSCSGCWQALFTCRSTSSIARVQFAMAG